MTQTWKSIEDLLSQGISLIPVRDKPDGNRPAKTPFGSWKEYQSRIITKQELFYQMDEKFKTEAVAIVCGKVSGNLELIDIDVKQWIGIDARLFNSIRECYPDLWSKLRIHKTPSGGYHILYKVSSGEIPGNKKLAYKEDCKESGIETRGEGGYALCPPSMGYSLHLNGELPIPCITWEERCSLINLCISFNEKVQKAKSIYNEAKHDSYYSENPFEDFNGSSQAEDVLTQNGWSIEAKNPEFIHYCRPGKQTGTSATFNRKNRLFYFFTTSTDFEANRCYNPATVLAMVQFGNDKKKTHQWLVDHGFGKINPERERQIIGKAALSNKPLPANASEEAKQQYQQAVEEVNERYPYGIFWREDENGSITISRQKLYIVAGCMGYRTDGDIYLIDGYKLRSISYREFWDTMKDYIKEEDEETYDKICDAFEAFIQNSGAFTVDRLPLLNTADVLVSTKHRSYKFYNNCYLSIDKDGITKNEYENLGDSWLIYEKSIIKRDYVEYSDGLYADYLNKAIGINDRLKQIIGYLAHDYKDEAMGYIIVLCESAPDPKLGGGSGKNIFTSLIGKITSYINIPGSQIQFNEKFLQSWNYQRVMSISDVDKKFNFSFLKELSTGSGILKKLFKDEKTIDATMMPKFVVSTNFSFDVSDGGLRRRIIPIEFTDFFTKAGGVDVHYNKMFPSDWNEEEWYSFDTFMMNCIWEYHKIGGKLFSVGLTDGGRQKQFDLSHGQLTREFIECNIESWIISGTVTINNFNKQYDQFCLDNNISNKFKLSSIGMNKALDEYCQWKEIEFIKSEDHRVNSVIQKCKKFVKKIFIEGGI